MTWECFFCGKEMEVVEGQESMAGACGHCEVRFTAKEGPLLDFIKTLNTEEHNDVEHSTH
jgi:transcription elongation factor Elf1